MATLYGTNTTPRSTTPPGQVAGSVQGGHVRVYRENIALAAQATTDTIAIAFPSKGERFLYGVLTTDTTLGTSTIAIGTAASTAKYKAAAAFTATDTPTFFGKASAMTADLTVDETVIITIAVAALPASGNLVVDMYFAQT